MTSYPHRVLTLASAGEERKATVYRNPSIHVWVVSFEAVDKVTTTLSYKSIDEAEKAASDFIHRADDE